MRVYFVRDGYAHGGHFAIYREVPIMSEERVTISEVRVGEFPDDLIQRMDTGDIVADGPYHFDGIIVPYWENAEVWWTRQTGYVGV